MTKEREALKLVLSDIETNYAAVRTRTIIAIKEALVQPEQEWTPEDMAYRPGGLVQPDPTPEQLAALGWQSIECPFCGSSGAQAFPKPETDWEGIAADQAMTIALMKSEQEPIGEVVEQDTTHHGYARALRPYQKTPVPKKTKLYTSPPKREWVGLMPADFEKLEQLYGQQVSNDFAFANIVCQVEAELKEKNHD